jgi:tetratricopeptide (TPR) repeat protein
MRKLALLAFMLVILGITALQVEAVPTVPPIPPPPTEPPEPPPEPPPDTPTPGGGGPLIEEEKKFTVFTTEPLMEGYAGGNIEYQIKVSQKGYPDLTVHLEAEIPKKWKATFSKNDFDLKTEETIDLTFTLSPPDDVSTEKEEIKIRAEGVSEERNLKAKDTLILTAMTYLIDVGITNLQLSPPQPTAGDNVSVTATAVNYTQRTTSNITVEFLVDNQLISRQSLTLTGGVSQPLTFGWTAKSGTSNLVIKAQVPGDNNRRNDTAAQQVMLGGGTEQIEALYQQAFTLYAQESYSEAKDIFALVAAQYTEAGEHSKALEANQYVDLCDSYIGAQSYMNQGDQAFQSENYQLAAENYLQARDLYAEAGDAQKQTIAQEKYDEALAAQGSGLNYTYIGISVIGVAVVILLTLILSRRRGRVRPATTQQQPSRFRLEEPARQEPSPRGYEPPSTRDLGPQKPTQVPKQPTPATTAPPPEMIQFHQKTEEALSRFTKGSVRENLQQAMRVYLSLEGERKQLPKGKDLELDRLIDTNLRELEHRIFGTF